jgi:hypothetical protein
MAENLVKLIEEGADDLAVTMKDLIAISNR